MPALIIDGKTYEVEAGQNLLHAVISLKLDLPYFCWHPAMGSVGACRQCAVLQFKDEHDTKGRIVMACMTPVADGLRISIDGHDARAFRANVIEWLMVNHPHDCPVCDEGGECHLQDMTLMSGHNYRRYRFTKRTHRNQDLGPFINHEMNRCITCYRCVRYYRDYAGGNDLDAFAIHDSVYFGRSEDGTLENEFSGNLVEICPTGVFTDKTLGRHYTRKWDQQYAPSVCVHCSVGCNTIAGARYGTLRRIVNRYNREVNGYFLCDRGRFGYEFVNGPDRIRQPQIRPNRTSGFTQVTPEEAARHVAALIAAGRNIIGIGSPRATLESNYALRAWVGRDRFFSGMSRRESALVKRIREIIATGPVRSASLHDIERSDAVVILGEDLTNTAPMMAFAVRQAIKNQPTEAATKLGIPRWNDAALREAIQYAAGPLFIAAGAPTRLDDVASGLFHAPPEEIARFAAAVTGSITGGPGGAPEVTEEIKPKVEACAAALTSATRITVIAGTSLMSEAVVEAAARLAWVLAGTGKEVGLAYALGECNSMGASLLEGRDLEEAAEAISRQGADTVVILENDLYRRIPSQVADTILASSRNLVVMDQVLTATALQADVMLPASSFAEWDGTLINYEGRAQRAFQVVSPDGIIQESWRWVRDIQRAEGTGPALRWQSLDTVMEALAGELPALAPILAAAPESGFRVHGKRAARQPRRFSGRTAMFADRTMHEPPPPEDLDSPLAFTMEGYQVREQSPLIPFFWEPGWNSVQSTNKYQKEAGGILLGGTPGVLLFGGAGKGKETGTFTVPPPFRQHKGEWLVVPAFQIFGSEELSARAAGLAQRIPRPAATIAPQSAAALGVNPGDEIAIEVDGQVWHGPVAVLQGVPEGVVTLTAGTPGMERWILPARGRVQKEHARGSR